MANFMLNLYFIMLVVFPVVSTSKGQLNSTEEYQEETVVAEELEWYDDNFQMEIVYPHMGEATNSKGEEKRGEEEVKNFHDEAKVQMTNSTKPDGLIVRIKRSPILVLMKVKRVVDIMIQIYEFYRTLEGIYLKAMEIHNKTLSFYNKWSDRYQRLNMSLSKYHGARYHAYLEEREPPSRAHRFLIGWQNRQIVKMSPDVDPPLETITEYMRVTFICPGVLEEVNLARQYRQEYKKFVEFYNGTDPIQPAMFIFTTKIGTFEINPSRVYDTAYYSCYVENEFRGHVNLEVLTYGEAEMIGFSNFCIIATTCAALGFVYNCANVTLWCFFHRKANNGWYIRPEPRRKPKKPVSFTVLSCMIVEFLIPGWR